MNHLTTCIVQSSVPGVTPTCLDDGLNPASHPNPIEHIWDMLGRRIQAREPPVQNILQLEAALHWQAAITGHPTSNWRDETQG
jgi:hypothetical protein